MTTPNVTEATATTGTLAVENAATAEVVRDILRRCLEPTMAMIRDLVAIERLARERRT